MAKYNEHGEQIPDQTPVEIPVGFRQPESLQSMITRLVRAESTRAAQLGTHETFEESDDFDVDEDPQVISPYQMTTLQEEAPHLAKTLEPPKGVDPTKDIPKDRPEDRDAEYRDFLAWKAARAPKKSEEWVPEHPKKNSSEA